MAGAAGQTWFEHQYQHDYLEVILRMILAFFALCFENVWHSVSSRAKHSYRYGQQLDASPILRRSRTKSIPDMHQRHHVRLLEQLVHRMGAEFMTLGFLAFCIFVFNNAGGFEWMADHIVSGEDRYPDKPEAWLHLAEVVHMQLFLGMILYFVLLRMIIEGSIQYIEQLESIQLRHFAGGGPGQARLQPAQDMLNADKGTQVFVRWRSHFLSKASRWETTRPELYEDILEHVRFDPHDRQDHDFLPMLEERLDFSAYLSLCVEQGIVDAVHGTTVTWIILLVIFGIFAILTKYAHTTLMAITAYCIAMASVVLGLMRHVSRRRQARILRHISSSSCSTDVGGGRVEDEHAPGGPAAARGSVATAVELAERLQALRLPAGRLLLLLGGRRHRAGIWALRLMQILLFLISYMFASSLIDIEGWRSKPLTVLLLVALFALLFALLALLLPSEVPQFLAIMALRITEGTYPAFFAALSEEPQWKCLNGRSPSSSQIFSAETKPRSLAAAEDDKLWVALRDLEQRVGAVERQAGTDGNAAAIAAVRATLAALNPGPEPEAGPGPADAAAAAAPLPRACGRPSPPAPMAPEPPEPPTLAAAAPSAPSAEAQLSA